MNKETSKLHRAHLPEKLGTESIKSTIKSLSTPLLHTMSTSPLYSSPLHHTFGPFTPSGVNPLPSALNKPNTLNSSIKYSTNSELDLSDEDLDEEGSEGSEITGESKTPTFEYYGFTLYLLSYMVFGIYLAWAYLPDNILHQLGITYYCSRYWALAIPAYLIMLIPLIMIVTISLDLINTPSFESCSNLVDSFSTVSSRKTLKAISNQIPLFNPSNLQKGQENNISQDDAIPNIEDLPISMVNACMFQPHRWKSFHYYGNRQRKGSNVVKETNFME